MSHPMNLLTTKLPSLRRFDAAGLTDLCISSVLKVLEILLGAFRFQVKL